MSALIQPDDQSEPGLPGTGARSASAATAKPAAGLRLAVWLCDHELWLLAAAGLLLLFPRGAGAWLGMTVLGLAWAARWRATGRLSAPTPLDFPVLLLAGLGLLGYAVSPAPGLSWARWWSLLYSLAVFYAFANWVHTRRRQQIAVLILAGLTLSMAAAGLLGADWSQVRLAPLPGLYERLPNLLPGLPNSGVVTSSELINPRSIGISLGYLLPVFIGLAAFGRPGWLRWTAAAVVIAGLIVLLLSQAIQGLAGLLVGLAFLLAWRWRWARLALPLALLALLLGLWLIGPARWLAPLLRIDNPLGIAVSLRLDIWSRAQAMLHDLPYTGIGLNAFQALQASLYPGYLIGLEPHAHNLFLQTALDFGLAGLFGLAWLLAAWGMSAWRGYHRAGQLPEGRQDQVLIASLAAGLVAFLVSGLLDVQMLGAKPGAALWLLLALGITAPPGILAAPDPKARRRRWLEIGLPLGLLAILLLTSFFVWPAALPMNLGALQANKALARLQSAPQAGLTFQQDLLDAQVWLQRAAAADPQRVFAFELLGQVAAWRGDYPAAVQAFYRRAALEAQESSPLQTYYPPEYLLRLLGDGAAPAAGQAQELQRIYTTWMLRYPERAEHYLRLAALLALQNQPEQAGQVLNQGLQAGARPGGLLESALAGLGR